MKEFFTTGPDHGKILPLSGPVASPCRGDRRRGTAKRQIRSRRRNTANADTVTAPTSVSRIASAGAQVIV
ncbi:hypothetical protein GA0070614_4463 [Micromonospora coxensis]|uniref:Uncharacterized protein n=1 Tax=Micromonospora coxensis TaxID=356852 RepID=A0A1C5JEB5_9ACTN|nr:hypothetical protein GA0070614_4463 [Micromonospora coxensis]